MTFPERKNIPGNLLNDDISDILRQAKLWDQSRRYDSHGYTKPLEIVKDDHFLLQDLNEFVQHIEGISKVMNDNSKPEDEVIQDVKTSEDKVWLGTIHRAKGCEWEVVFILGANDDVFRDYQPTNMEEEEKYFIDESYRLLYVAMSRAKSNVFVTFNSSNRDKQNSVAKPLRNVYNLPSNIIARKVYPI